MKREVWRRWTTLAHMYTHREQASHKHHSDIITHVLSRHRAV